MVLTTGSGNDISAGGRGELIVIPCSRVTLRPCSLDLASSRRTLASAKTVSAWTSDSSPTVEEAWTGSASPVRLASRNSDRDNSASLRLRINLSCYRPGELAVLEGGFDERGTHADARQGFQREARRQRRFRMEGELRPGRSDRYGWLIVTRQLLDRLGLGGG